MTTKINLNQKSPVYFIGIKGSGMTALAEILNSKGFKVSGSDTEEIFFTDQLLKKAGIKFREEFSKKNIDALSEDYLVIRSAVYHAKNNVEVARAEERGLTVLTYPEAVGALFNQSFGIAVCGTHGKTTTTAMLSEIFRLAELDPTALVGSKVTNWQSSALSGSSRYFIIEADEFQNKLKFYDPQAVIATNIDYDHPDFFKDKKAYTAVFKDFFLKIPKDGFLVFNVDDADAKAAAKGLACQRIGFGEDDEAQFQLVKREVMQNGNGQELTVKTKTAIEQKISLGICGKVNALNALAATALARQFNIDWPVINKALKEFASSERRFQKMGEVKGALLFDDYAHHPEEIRATLQMAREKFPAKKIVIAFHPHTFSRTQKFLKEFAEALALADSVYVLEIYASARENKADFDVSAPKLVELVNEIALGKARYVPDLASLAPMLKKQLAENMIFLSLGAGDVWKIHEKIIG